MPHRLCCHPLIWLLCLTLPTMGQPDSIKEPTAVRVLPKHEKTWRGYATITLDHLSDFKPVDIPLSQYGGRKDRKEPATGFFYAKKLQDRWILVDPEGYHFYTIGVNSIKPEKDTPDSRHAFSAKFGSIETWAQQTHTLLADEMGFNTIGRWSSAKTFHQAETPMPYTVGLAIIGNYAREKGLLRPSYGSTELHGDVLPVFNEDFPAYVDAACQKLSAIREDPWVLGIMSDNEIPLFDKQIIQRYLRLGKEDPGAQFAMKWLSARGIREDAIRAEDDHAFAVLVLSRYFKLVREGIRRYAPNHMYLGTRFHKTILEQDSAYEAAAPYLDAITINLYHRWNINQAAIDRVAAIADKPLIITEWYAKGIDSGLRNYSGAGFLVETQAERGLFYENFALSILRNPNIVGWHWFRYMDDGPLDHGRQASNKGLLNVHFEPYAELAQAAARINHNAYALRDYLLPLESEHLPDGNILVETPPSQWP